MNGNEHSAATRARTGLLVALLSSIRRACGRMRQRRFGEWGGAIRTAAHQLALTMAVAGAGHAHAAASDGWASMSPNAGYGFGFYMEIARSQAHVGTAPGKYDLLYSDQDQITDVDATRRKAGNRSTTAPPGDTQVDPVLRNLGGAGVMTVALGMSAAVPMMVFTGSVSNRCIGRVPDCGRDAFSYLPVSPPYTP